ncbi:MAG: ASCH domain-containing protein [Pseudonocardiaceae bacterium]
MTGPFLDLIVAGIKTIESRFHRQRRTPLFTAKPGDVVVFRQSGRPASMAAILGDTYYLDMTESDIDQIRATWAPHIGCDDDNFWATRADARMRADGTPVDITHFSGDPR